MSENSDTAFDLQKEIAESNARLPLDLSHVNMPLDVTIRCTALAIAQRHSGDRTVKEGALYNALKMDNKLGGPLTASDVIRAAIIFERFLWGEWSKGMMIDALKEARDATFKALEEEIAGEDGPLDEEPTREHGGGE